MKITNALRRGREDPSFDASAAIWNVLCDRNVLKVPVSYLRHEVATVVLARLVEDQTNNGGIDALFYNGWGECARDCVKALQEVGAATKAGVLQTAMDSYWSGRYPRTSVEWKQLVDAAGEDNQELIPNERDLERIFYEESEDINDLIVKFVERNIDAFEPSLLPHPPDTDTS